MPVSGASAIRRAATRRGDGRMQPRKSRRAIAHGALPHTHTQRERNAAARAILAVARPVRPAESRVGLSGKSRSSTADSPPRARLPLRDAPSGGS